MQVKLPILSLDNIISEEQSGHQTPTHHLNWSLYTRVQPCHELSYGAAIIAITASCSESIQSLRLRESAKPFTRAKLNLIRCGMGHVACGMNGRKARKMR